MAAGPNAAFACAPLLQAAKQQLGSQQTTDHFRWSMTVSRKSLIQDMYNRRAPQYDTTTHHIKLAELLFAQVPLRSGDNVLDLCTGTGLIALEAARRVGEHGSVVGVDFADDMLRVARAKAKDRDLKNVSFVLEDVEAVDLQEESFDAAFCSAAAVWLDSLPAALRRWRGLLKAGGVFAFNGWTEGSFVGGAILQHVSWARGIKVPNWHAHTGSSDRCRTLLETAGLEAVTVHVEDMSRFEDPQKLKEGFDGLVCNTPSGSSDGSTLADLYSPELFPIIKAAYFDRVDELRTDAGVPNEIITFTVVGRRPAAAE